MQTPVSVTQTREVSANCAAYGRSVIERHGLRTVVVFVQQIMLGASR